MQHRSAQIDILRAVAVLLVLVRHMRICPKTTSPFLNGLNSVVQQGGWVGVDLFFVLSGFLVSGLLFREQANYGTINIRQFLIRRGFKLYPAFWTFIATTGLLLFWRRQPASIPEFLSEVLFYQNYHPSALKHGWWVHTWSLAVEEHFYILLVFMLFFMSKRKSRDPFNLIPPIFVCVALASLIMRIATASGGPYTHGNNVFPSHLRLDSLFFGVLISYLFHLDSKRFLLVSRGFRVMLAAFGCLLLAPAFYFQLEITPSVYTWGFTAFYIGSGCLLVSVLGSAVPDRRLFRAAAYVGSHSYSIYLWHMLIGAQCMLCLKLVGLAENWFAYALVFLVGAVVEGIAAAKVIEFPMLRIRDRWFPARSLPLQKHHPIDSLPMKSAVR